MMEIKEISPLKVQQLHMELALAKHEKLFYEKFVERNLDEIIEIALITKGQAAVQRFVLRFFFLLKLFVYHHVNQENLANAGGTWNGS